MRENNRKYFAGQDAIMSFRAISSLRIKNLKKGFLSLLLKGSSGPQIHIAVLVVYLKNWDTWKFCDLTVNLESVR